MSVYLVLQEHSLSLVSMFAYLVLEDRTGHRTLLDLSMVRAIFASLGPTLMKRDQLSARDVLQA